MHVPNTGVEVTVFKKGGIGSIIAIMVIVALLLTAVVLMINILSKQTSVSQATVQAVAKQQLASEVAQKLSACYATFYDPLAGTYVLAIKTSDIPTFCQYVKAIQALEYINGQNVSEIFAQNMWLSKNTRVLYSACLNNYKPTYLTYKGIKLPVALEIELSPQTSSVYRVQMLLSKVGWKALDNCLKTTGGVIQYTTIQQTTTIFSIGPITVLAAGGVNPLQYICPPPKTVVGDDYAYEIALVLNPQFNGTRNDVPTSIVLNLKDIIEKAAPASSPLRYYINDVYLRNITVMRIVTTPSIYQVSWGATSYLPWSYTFLNLTTGQTPLEKSSGVLTFDFKAPAPMKPNSLTQYSAVVCLYLGIAGQYPPSSTGEPFDGKIFTQGKDVTPPGSDYPCYSFSGYDVCYVPAANLTTTYARNVTSAAGLRFVGLQYPVDTTVRTYKLVISNPNSVPLYDQVVRVKLPPQLNGTNITIVDEFGGTVKFCYETFLGNCTSAAYTNATAVGPYRVADGYIWVRVPYIPAGGKVTLSIIPGKNGGSSPYDVFPVYVDFAKAKVEVTGFSWTWNFPGYAFTQSAAVFSDPKNALNFVANGYSFSVAAVVRWDGAFNFNSEDTVNFYVDPTWPDAATLTLPGWARLDVGYWLYPIVYQVDPTSGTGWMLAIYRGLPVLLEITNSGALYLKAAAAQTLVPGIKYLIIAGYDNTTNTWNIYVKPLETLQGSAPPLPSVTLGAELLEEINSFLGTTGQYSLMYTLFTANTPSVVISDASRYYDASIDDETIASFSGVIYNVTIFNNYASPTTIAQCLAAYNPTACPAVYFHTDKPDAYGLRAWVVGVGDEYSTDYQLWWYISTTGLFVPANLIDWQQATVNSVVRGLCLPYVGEINITIVKGVHVVAGTFFGTPVNGDSAGAWCTPLWKAAQTIEAGILSKDGAIVLNSTWLGQAIAWNFWLNPVVPKGTYYEVRVGMNGGSYGQYGGTVTSGPPWARSTTYLWQIFYPYVPAVVGDGKSWLKWMIYEDPSALERFITSRNGFWGDAWRIYLISYSSEPVPAVTSPNDIYYNIVKYDLSRPAVYFNVFEGGPLGQIFYYGSIDLSTTNLAVSYQQLLPKQVEYIGFSYMDASNSTTIGAIGTDARKYYFMFARTLPPIPLDDYATVESPDLLSPKVDAPIVYMKKSGIPVLNVTGPYNITLTFDVLGNTSATLALNTYGAYANTTGYFERLSDFLTNVTVAPFWNLDVYWFDVASNAPEVYAALLNLPISDVNKWNVVAFNITKEVLSTNVTNYYNNITLAYMPETGDYVISFNNVTSKLNATRAFVIGLSDTLQASQVYANVAPPLILAARTYDSATKAITEVNGLLDLAKMNYDISALNGTSIIMINKLNWYVTISGPYCIKCT